VKIAHELHPSNPLEAEIRRVAREEARDLLRELGVTTASVEYSTDSLPPGTSRRVFCETCHSGMIDGAIKTGRVWSCPAASWHAARGRRPVATPKLQLVENVDVDALVRESLASGERR
jgi:hypothetical protein